MQGSDPGRNERWHLQNERRKDEGRSRRYPYLDPVSTGLARIAPILTQTRCHHVLGLGTRFLSRDAMQKASLSS